MIDQTASPEESIVASIRQIMRGVDRHSRRLLQTCGLTGPQLALLRTLQSRPSACASEIAEMLHISQATVSGIVDRLESRGLVARERGSGDRRRVEIRLTGPGSRLLGGAPSLLQDSFRRRLMGLEDWELLQILASLRRVAALMSAEDLDAAPMLVSGALEADESDEAGGEGPAEAGESPMETRGMPRLADGRRWFA